MSWAVPWRLGGVGDTGWGRGWGGLGIWSGTVLAVCTTLSDMVGCIPLDLSLEMTSTISGGSVAGAGVART
jgi:hypothetical protein